ncbi:MAG: hypothetical protein HUJ69_04150 [Lachnospiraceae bacterium]|nr:hypothetical protein [Lachnospiraceae bacterium]
MFACKNCGGKVVYNVEQRCLICEFCGTPFPIDAFDESTADNVTTAADPTTYETNVFICRNCGAEVASTDNQIVSFCSYCGSQSVLYEKTARLKKPQVMIPFRMSRNQMHQLYRNRLQKVKYLPPEYTDPRYIDSMRGIYIPFYANSVAMSSPATIKVTQITDINSSQYRVDEIQATITAASGQIPYYTDASSALEDAITEAIQPFPPQEIIPFNPAYLAGFYADQADVPPEKYIPSLLEKANEDAVASVNRIMGEQSKVDMMGKYPKGYPQGLPFYCKGYHNALFPVWFLTRRHKDRVSYAVANGATGQMTMDLPVDTRKYWTVTAIIAAVLFAVLALVCSLTAKTTLSLITPFTCFVMLTFHKQLRKVMEKETHLFDVGSPGYDAAKAEKYKAQQKKVSTGPFFLFVGLSLGAFLLYVGEGYCPVFGFVSAIFALVQMCKIASVSSGIQDKSLLLSGIFSFIMVLIASVILILQPVYDYWYYLGAICTLAGSLVPGTQLCRVYNLLASRPLPNYFQREGGLNHAR